MKTTAALSFGVLAALLTASTVAHAYDANGDGYDDIQPDAYGNYGDYQGDEGYGQQVSQVSDDNVADGYDDGYDPEAYHQFEEPLRSAGTWHEDPTYGRVWMPSPMVVGNDFTPYYTGGRWVLSEYGWTWVSDWSWGWAPFHYGRWVVIAGGEWAWVPGTVWGPAWVAWRSGDGYVGWAPLPPRGVRIAGYGVIGAASPWRFTLAANLGSARPVCIPHRQVPAIFARTTVLASNRVVTHGTWRTRINAGPVHVVHATPVRLAIVSPHAGPRYAIMPRAPRPLPQAQPRPAAPQPFQPRVPPYVQPRPAPHHPMPVPPHRQPSRGPFSVRVGHHH
jgi:hypothetical protein